MKKYLFVILVLLCILPPGLTSADYIVSDGSDGPFRPSTSLTLTPEADGRFDFSEIQIGSNIEVSFAWNPHEGPIELLGEGDIFIHGILDAGEADLILTSLSSILIAGDLWGESITIAANEITLDGTIHVPNSLIVGGRELTHLEIDSMGGGGSITIGDGANATIIEPGDIQIGGEGSVTITGGSTTSSVTMIPEPATILLVGSGLLGLAGLRKGCKKETINEIGKRIG